MSIALLRRRKSLSIAILATGVAWAFWPALHAAFYLDDFFLVAIARLLDDPFAAFANTHFPGGVFYRPAGMVFWWLAVKIFGNAPTANYAINLCLHIAIAAVLWRLLCRVSRGNVAPVLASLAFAVHPVAIGTSLWLADRFDLLATLFSVLALDAAWRHRLTRTTASIIESLIWVTLAVLSKEIGFAAFVPVVLMWLWPTDRNVGPWRQRGAAILASMILAAALFSARALVLGSPLETSYFNNASIATIFIEGFTRWATHLFGQVVVWQRLGFLGRSAEILGLLILVGGFFAGLGAVRNQRWKSDAVALAIATLALLLCTGVLQAPVARATPLQGGVELTAQLAIESRLFYFSWLALVIAVFAICTLAYDRLDRRPAVAFAACVALIFCALPWAAGSRHLARHFARDTRYEMSVLDAALRSVETLPLQGENCTVFALGLPSERKFLFEMQFDAAIKAMSPDLRRVQNCRFTGERTPWFYVLKAGALSAANALPMRPVFVGGQAVPWPSFGGVEIAYLNLFGSIEVKDMPQSQYIEMQNGHFVDVTREVSAGEKVVHFRCGRREEQCRIP